LQVIFGVLAIILAVKSRASIARLRNNRKKTAKIIAASASSSNRIASDAPALTPAAVLGKLGEIKMIDVGLVPSINGD
jgi:hypothetical protein